ncbi:hypothetical protein MBLNU230_g2337t1 [Neophaeotheca triangularis]
MPTLHRRMEEMTMAPELVIFLVIIGAAAAIAIGWGISHNYRRRLNNADMQDNREAQMDQVNYMREVRFRNKDTLQRAYGYPAQVPYMAPSGMGYEEGRDYDERSSAW